MNRVLALDEPDHEAPVDYYGDDSLWKGLTGIIEAKRREDIEVSSIINGEKVQTDTTYDSINPSDNTPVAKVYQAGPSDIGDAINAALSAKAEWGAMAPAARILAFRNLTNIIELRGPEIVAAETLECGYEAPESDGCRAEALDLLRFNSFWYNQILKESPKPGSGETNYTIQRPLKGFTSAITPFNFPFAMGSHLPFVMALAGNTVVWKPSSDAPYTSSLIMDCVDEAGIPPGVINMVLCSGKSFGEVALGHEELTAVNFVGSYSTAWSINGALNGHGPRPHFPKLLAETGGKDFMWIDESAAPWMDDVVAQSIAGAYGRTGQKCSAQSVSYIAKQLLADYIDGLRAGLQDFNVGDPTKERVDMGPVINKAAYDKISKYIDDARNDPGCDIAIGGEHSDKEGLYIQPTVILVKDKRHKLMREEIFGPVLTVYAFEKGKDEGDSLAALAEVGYKLTGCAYCPDVARKEQLLPVLSQLAGNFYIDRRPTAAMMAQHPFSGDGMSGTNSKAGSPNYIRHFISACSVAERQRPRPAR